MSIEPTLVRELWSRAGGARWSLTAERFEAALTRSLEKAFADERPDASAIARYLRSLHLEDLALATACEDGDDAAWEHFIREFRPQLYRAASAIDSTGGARDLADALYAELFGLKEKDGARQSLFRYFHGRSSLGTWLRSVLSQRHVDRIRTDRRLEPLPDEASLDAGQQYAGRDAPAGGAAPAAVDVPRCLAAFTRALAAVIAALAARDRLRLACYYAQGLTLAQIGRLTGEHEATVSRHLTRTRREVRGGVEAELERGGMQTAEVAECFEAMAANPGDLNLDVVMSEAPGRKNDEAPRSKK